MRLRRTIPTIGLAILAGVGWCANLASAADAPPPPASAPVAPGVGIEYLLQRGRAILDDLKLSDEQKTKVNGIYKKAQSDLDAMKADLAQMEPQVRFTRAKEFFEQVRDQLNLVLDDKQATQLEKRFAEVREEMRKRSEGPGGPRVATTRPSPAPAGPRGNVADVLRENLSKLDLSDDQRAKIRSVMDDARAKGQELREQIRNGSVEAREKARSLFEETRTKLTALLSDDQRDKLRELMQGGDATMRDNRRPRDREKSPPATTRAATDMQMQDSEMSMEGSSRKSKRGQVDVAVAPAEKLDLPGPAIGDSVIDLSVRKLDGTQLAMSSLKGRIVVLEFGSYSCPSFRNRVAAMEKLKADFGARVSFFVVYGKEAHPAGVWEVDRNKDDGITVEQPKSIDARQSLAKTAREKLKITAPFLVDTLGNDAAAALGAGPNSAYVIGRDGKLLARQEWFEPAALRRALEAATAAPAVKPAA